MSTPPSSPNSSPNFAFNSFFVNGREITNPIAKTIVTLAALIFAGFVTTACFLFTGAILLFTAALVTAPVTIPAVLIAIGLYAALRR